MEKKQINAGGETISYVQHDASSDVTMLFIHGNSLSKASFNSQYSDPSLKGFSMVGIDLPGHGDSLASPSPEETYSLVGFAKLIATFIDELNIDRVLIVGHSLGGHIAMEATTYSKKIAGLCIFGAPPVGLPPEMERMYLPHPAIGLIYQETLTQDEAESLASSFSSTHRSEIIKELLQTDPAMRPNLGASLGKGLFQDEKTICEQLDIPMSIFHGSDDPLINDAYYADLQLPTQWQGHVHVVTNAAHSPQLEQPEAFNKLLVNFAKSVQ